jgi:hypothetical protein
MSPCDAATRRLTSASANSSTSSTTVSASSAALDTVVAAAAVAAAALAAAATAQPAATLAVAAALSSLSSLSAAFTTCASGRGCWWGAGAMRVKVRRVCGPGCVSAVFDGADWDAPRIACLVALVICSIGERGNPRLGLTARPRDAAQLMWFVGKDRPSPGTGELLLRLSQGSSKRQDLCCRSVAGTANATGEIFSFVLAACGN